MEQRFTEYLLYAVGQKFLNLAMHLNHLGSYNMVSIYRVPLPRLLFGTAEVRPWNLYIYIVPFLANKEHSICPRDNKFERDMSKH